MEADLGNSLPSRIASLVHAHFDALPPRSKPIIRSDGTKEWIPMSGMVIVRGENTPSEQLTCVAVTSGAKCLSASQIPNCKGLVLHDCHAEILCLRAFNYWLLSECQSFLSAERTSPGDDLSPFLQRRHQQNPHMRQLEPPLELHPDLKIYMYCTCAPCGDASMELTMASQDDATPWATAPSHDRNPKADTDPVSSSSNTHDDGDGDGDGDGAGGLLDGRGYFSRLGIVRRKPARADAEATRSKSCSDKLSLRQVSSLLSYESSLLVAVTGNAYLAGVVMPEEEISAVGCERAFGETGRMKGLVGRVWRDQGYGQGQGYDCECRGEDGDGRDETVYGYRYRPFRVLFVPTTLLRSLWQYRKPRSTEPESVPESTKVKPGVVSAVWVAAPSGSAVVPAGNNGAKSLPKLSGSKTGLYETILNGVKQGSKASQPMAKGASALSRARMWGLLRDIIQVSGSSGDAGGIELDEILERIVTAPTYQGFKKGPVVSTGPINARKQAIQDTKAELKGWVSNSGDEGWGLDVLVDPPKRKRLLTDDLSDTII